MPARDIYRLFIALSVASLVKEELRRAQNGLRACLPAATVSWTRIKQIHLTLKFLGDVDASRAEDLTESVRNRCAGIGPLLLRAAKIGFFPSAHRPKVIWAGVAAKENKLEHLQQQVESAAADFTSIEENQPFVGHLTLGRIKQIRSSEAQALVRAAEELSVRDFGSWTANSVAIIRSELTSTGSRYTCLAEISL